jgi:hypothetical protein
MRCTGYIVYARQIGAANLLTLMRDTATLIVFDIFVLTTLPTCCNAKAAYKRTVSNHDTL